MLSSLSYAILALLAGKPQSGYDISRQMKPPLGHTWQATHTQIYPELARLVKGKLVTVQRIDQGAGPPRRIHAITPAGRAELVRWAGRAPQARPLNDELVVKAYALRRVRGAAVAELMAKQIALHEHRLAALEQLAAARQSRATKTKELSASEFGEHAALRRAIGAEREVIAWCHWLAREVGTGPASLAGSAVRQAPARHSRAARTQ